MINLRWCFTLAAVVCAALLGAGLYLQHVMDLKPCPLCIFQRVAFIALGITFTLIALHYPRRLGILIYGVLLSICALSGIGFAARQLWLQSLPADQVPACGPGLSYMLERFPVSRMIEQVFVGSGECAEVSWRLMGLSIAGWSLIWFALLLVFGIFALRQRLIQLGANIRREL
jgi:disulfide bond formation protein DsbB